MSTAHSSLHRSLRSSARDLFAYIEIARIDHWFKNVFILPGIVLGFFFYPQQLETASVWQIAFSIFATCLIASSYYILNEILDAPTDIHHPLKASRPIPSGRVYVPFAYAEWLILAAAGLGLAYSVSSYLAYTCLMLWIMGGLYNIPPIRLKDIPYLDVLSESLNNPLRLGVGWYATGLGSAPPISVILAYWMFGAFLMAVKRFGEYRAIGDPVQAGNYRRSFQFYDEKRLLLSITFYVSLFAMFAAVFMTRYRLELLFAAPLIAYALAYYLNLGFQVNSPVQRPENLWREKKLVLAVGLNVIVICILFFVDIAFLQEMLYPWHIPPGHRPLP